MLSSNAGLYLPMSVVKASASYQRGLGRRAMAANTYVITVSIPASSREDHDPLQPRPSFQLRLPLDASLEQATRLAAAKALSLGYTEVGQWNPPTRSSGGQRRDDDADAGGCVQAIGSVILPPREELMEILSVTSSIFSTPTASPKAREGALASSMTALLASSGNLTGSSSNFRQQGAGRRSFDGFHGHTASSPTMQQQQQHHSSSNLPEREAAELLDALASKMTLRRCNGLGQTMDVPQLQPATPTEPLRLTSTFPYHFSLSMDHAKLAQEVKAYYTKRQRRLETHKAYIAKKREKSLEKIDEWRRGREEEAIAHSIQAEDRLRRSAQKPVPEEVRSWRRHALLHKRNLEREAHESRVEAEVARAEKEDIAIRTYWSEVTVDFLASAREEFVAVAEEEDAAFDRMIAVEQTERNALHVRLRVEERIRGVGKDVERYLLHEAKYPSVLQ